MEASMLQTHYIAFPRPLLAHISKKCLWPLSGMLLHFQKTIESIYILEDPASLGQEEPVLERMLYGLAQQQVGETL